MNLRKAAEQALDALEEIGDEWGFTSERTVPNRTKAIQALRQALAPEVTPEINPEVNEPEGWVKIDEVRRYLDSVGCGTIYKTAGEGRVPLYAAPQREWVGLSDEEIQAERHKLDLTAGWTYDNFARTIEAKLREKNT